MTFRSPVSYASYRGNVLTVAPVVEPVTADELRTQLRTDSTDLPDTQANDYITEARQEFEDQTGIAMISQTWKLSLDGWSAGGKESVWWDGVRDGAIDHLLVGRSFVELPRYPLASISSVTTYSEDSTATAVVVADVFDVDTQQVPGRLALRSGQVWPSATRSVNAVEIVYVSGYGAAASDVPAPLCRAVRSMAAYLYQHRGDCGAGDAYQQSGAASVAAKYKVARL